MAQGQGWSKERVMGHAYLTNILKCVFDEYNFIIISNLFRNNNLYALALKHAWIEKAQTKCIIFGKALRIKGQKFCLKNFLNSIKMAIITCKFFKNFWGACPRNPQERFLFLDLLKETRPEKPRLKMSNFGAPLNKFWKRPRMEHIQRACVRGFGFKRWTSLYLLFS